MKANEKSYLNENDLKGLSEEVLAEKDEFYSKNVNTLLRMKRRAVKKGQYKFADDLMNLILKIKETQLKLIK